MVAGHHQQPALLGRHLRQARKKPVQGREHDGLLLRRALVGQDIRQKELKQRQARLEDARQKGQKRIIPAWEGQVRATQERISELEQQCDSNLEELQKKRDVNLSIELLNMALVVVKSRYPNHKKQN